MPSFSDVPVVSPLPAFAGIFDPGVRFDADRARRELAGAVGTGEPDHVLAEGPLAAAANGRGSFAAAVAGVQCLLRGTVYNDDVLAAELGLATGAGPAELIAAGYARWGDELPARLRGAFTFVVWDARAGNGLLAQDQFATRSLYLSSSGPALRFGDDLSVLLRLLPRRPSPDRATVVQWLANADPPAGRTLYEGIWPLGGAHCLAFGAHGFRRRRYWYPRYETPLALSREEFGARLWESLRAAIRARARAGERVGIMMSGGIDSAAVASAAVEAVDEARIRGYSAVFPDDPRIDESPRIRALADALGLSSTQAHVQPCGAVALAVDYARTWDSPLPGPGYMIEYPLLARAALDGVTTVIEGQGGDEVFGPSPFVLADLLARGRAVRSIALARRFPGTGGNPPWRPLLRFWMYYAVEGLLSYGLHRAVRRSRGARRYAPEWFSDESSRLLLETSEAWRWKRTDVDGPRWWRFHADLMTRSREAQGLCDYLRHRTALLGLEAHPPLLDVELVDVVLRMPPELGFTPDFTRLLIRECMAGRVPDEVRLSRAKSNLAPLYHASFTGPDLEHIRRLLGPDAEVRAYGDAAALERLTARPPAAGEAGWLPWLSQVSMLVSTEAWLRNEADPGFLEALAPRLTRPQAEFVAVG